MLDPTKIPLGRLAVAYGLSAHEMESITETLGATFNYAWMSAEYNFIYPGLELFTQYNKENLKVIIEEIFQADDIYYARVEGFTFVPSSSGSIFDYQEILSSLSDMRHRAEEHLSDPEGMAQKYGITPPTLEGTEHMLKTLYRDKLLLAVRDMCLVDKKSAVLFLESHDLHLQQEVKGLSRQFVESTLAEKADLTESPTRQEKVSAKKEEVAQPSLEEAENAAQQWLKYSQEVRPPKGNKREFEAAQIAMHKWRGKSQKEIFDMVFPQEKSISSGTKKKRITGYKALVQKLSQDHSLPFPPW